MKRWLKPASPLWLLRWELLHALRSLGARRGSFRLPGALSWLLRGLLLLLMHAIPAFLIWISQHASRTPSINEAQQLTQMLALLGQISFAPMVLVACYTVINQLSSKQALDLQLSSPVALASLSRARQYQVALNSLLGFPLLILPFANVGPFLGQFHLLLLYPAILGYALIASAAGQALAGGLLRLFGVARVKRYGSWASLLFMGSGFFIQHLIPKKGEAVGQAGAWSEFWAGSVSGAWLPSLAFLLVGIVLTLTSSRAFGRMVLEASNTADSQRAKPVSHRFNLHLPWLILRQQWKLMLRNPMTAANLLTPLSTMIFPFMKGAHDPDGQTAGYAISAAMLGMIAPLSSYTLCWSATALDEAPALVFGAPQNRNRLWRWQLLAALIPVWVVLLPPVLLQASQSLWQGMALALVCLVSSLSTAVLARWRFRPVSRAEARTNNGFRSLELIGLMLYCSLWAGIASSTRTMGLGLALLPFALLVPAWVLMRMEERDYLYD
ncbi:hypothetical protein [Chitinimonas sp.]|uniref:hypothetical protein n=1 Tax=Chitinimonas sp. TaxID=1934313 RepID=UPI0035B1571D